MEVEVPLVALLLEPKLNAGAEADNFGLGLEVEVEGPNEKLGFEVVVVLAALLGGLKAKLGVEEGAAIGAGDAEEVEVEFEAVVDEPKLKVGVEGFAAAGVVPEPKPVKPAKGEGVAWKRREERRGQRKRTRKESFAVR